MSKQMMRLIPMGSCPKCQHKQFVVYDNQSMLFLTNRDGEIIDSKDVNGKKIRGKTQTLYILEKPIFRKAVETTVKSFVSSDDYNKFAEDKQIPIEDTGKLIENIYIKNKITIKGVIINKLIIFGTFI